MLPEEDDSMKLFHIADDSDIKDGKTTDIYFVRTKKILKAKGLMNTHVVAEITSGRLPNDWSWGVLCGIEEVAHLMEGLPINLYSMPEGSIFRWRDYNGFREPIISIEGPYGEFCAFETPLLGLICQSSGVATKAARIRKVAGEKSLIAFGIRRMHPALSPMLDRAAYIGGFDGVSSLLGAQIIGEEPIGTMPHALIIVFGDQVKAWKAFDEVIPPEVSRVALVDTYFDEKTEAIMAAKALEGKLNAVRLDTPSSRRGNLSEIIREVRWELDVRGYKDVKIFVSGGVDEDNVKKLCRVGVDAFGIGTSVSNAPTVDFAMDIVSVKSEPAAKRGKLGGKKQVWRCSKCMIDIVTPYSSHRPRCPKCSGELEAMLKPLILEGELAADLKSPKDIRDYVLQQLERLNASSMDRDTIF